MSACAVQRDEIRADGCPHPYDVDRKRIERALEARARYRYVTPSVRPATGGYRIESPCCSRNLDPDGGVVDIALLQYDTRLETWRLFRRDHAALQWRLQASDPRLGTLLEKLNADPERLFWR